MSAGEFGYRFDEFGFRVEEEDGPEQSSNKLLSQPLIEVRLSFVVFSAQIHSLNLLFSPPMWIPQSWNPVWICVFDRTRTNDCVGRPTLNLLWIKTARVTWRGTRWIRRYLAPTSSRRWSSKVFTRLWAKKIRDAWIMRSWNREIEFHTLWTKIIAIIYVNGPILFVRYSPFTSPANLDADERRVTEEVAIWLVVQGYRQKLLPRTSHDVQTDREGRLMEINAERSTMTCQTSRWKLNRLKLSGFRIFSGRCQPTFVSPVLVPTVFRD